MKRRIGALVDRLPFGRRVRRLRRAIYRRLDAVVSEEPALVVVAPNDVRSMVGPPYDKYLGLRVLDGDWDLDLDLFEDHDIYRATEARIKTGVMWADTEFYHRVIGQIESGFAKWGCTTREEFDVRCDQIDALIENIVTDGFVGSAVFGRQSEMDRDLISLYVGRSGDLIFQDGRHRLAIAKALEIPQVPALVVRRHREWEDRRSAVLSLAKGAGGVFKGVLPHPDMHDIPQLPDDDEAVVLSAILAESGARSVVELGSYAGHLAAQLSHLGYECTAVSLRDEEAEVMSGLATIARWSFDISESTHTASACDAAILTVSKEGPVLLNVAQWLPPAFSGHLLVRRASADRHGTFDQKGCSAINEVADVLSDSGWMSRDPVRHVGDRVPLVLTREPA